MRISIELPLAILMACHILRVLFGSSRWSEEPIAKMTLDHPVDGRDGRVGLTRRLTDLRHSRLSRIDWRSVTCLPCVSMCFICVSLVTLPFQSPALANVAEGGGIIGKLIGPSGQIVAGARVIAKIQNPPTRSSGKSFEAFSGNDGIFALKDLPTGIYAVTVQADGFKSRIINPIRVTKSSMTRLNISLKVDKACGDTKASSLQRFSYG